MTEETTSPDDSGWFWFRENENSAPISVFISEDGAATYLDENGRTGELDDFIGFWEQAEINI